MTSMISPIQDLAIIGCFFLDGNEDWKKSQKVNFDHECGAGYFTFIALGFIPYWWRFAQCLRKVYDDRKKNWVQWINAGKYFSDLCVPLVALELTKENVPENKHKYHTDFWLWMYVAVHFVATTYSYIWDIYMDWGLMRCFDKGKWGLREKISYAPAFYYWGIFSDFVLRYIWILGMFAFGEKDSTFN